MSKSVDLLIKNGSIVSPGGISQADIGIANGKIVTLGDLGGVSAANVFAVASAVLDDGIINNRPGSIRQ